MTKEQAKAFEKKLLEKRRTLTAVAGAPVVPGDPNPEYGRDEGDRAVASQAKEMEWLQTSHGRGLLQMVEGALSRVREGTFGECAHCGQEIGAARLNAIPWTRYCITCQELLEQHGA